MQQPQGFVSKAFPSHVCKLQKSLYGLKQAPRAWFHYFTSHLLTHGFVASQADPSLFVRNVHGSITYLLLYVDDIILTGNDPTYVDSLVAKLKTVFDMTDLGVLTYFLGLEVQSKTTGLLVTQSKYASDVLHKFGMAFSKPCTTPCSSGSLDVDSPLCSVKDAKAYRSMVGALHYLTFTRPNISYAVSRVSQYMHSPTQGQLAVVKRVFRYIRGTLTAGLLFQKGSLTLTAFSDSDWAGSQIDCCSTTGFVIFLGNNPVSWLSKKQSTVSRSSTEAEYRALAAATAELCWLRQILKDLFVFLPRAPLFLCDNQSALQLARNPVFRGRTKHVEIDFHFVREKVASRDLQLQFVTSVQQLADLLTKPLTVDRLSFLRYKLMPSLAFV